MLPRIQKHINDQVTGCLQTSDGFGIPLQVYLMEGNLVAAHAGDDGRSLLRSLEQRGWLTHTKSEGLKTHLATTSQPSQQEPAPAKQQPHLHGNVVFPRL